MVVPVSLFALCLPTLAPNRGANVVSPANDFSHLWPRRISFRTGGLITGVLGILMRPSELIKDPTGYIFQWLVAPFSPPRARRRLFFIHFFRIPPAQPALRRPFP